MEEDINPPAAVSETAIDWFEEVRRVDNCDSKGLKEAVGNDILVGSCGVDVYLSTY